MQEFPTGQYEWHNGWEALSRQTKMPHIASTKTVSTAGFIECPSIIERGSASAGVLWRAIWQELRAGTDRLQKPTLQAACQQSARCIALHSN
jgi:hypothetical protein